MATDDAVTLESYQAQVEAFTERVLRPYIDRLAVAGKRTSSSKEFNDPVWGTISLSAVEVAVLDSPLLQRLRSIRQLGVVHLVYPGANHSRLEHSIGVCYQVSRMIDSAEQHAREAGKPLPDMERWRFVLRLTALCHDIGHGLFSHVTENALRLDRRANQLIRMFKQLHNKTAVPQLSEMAAYYMLGSPAFADLLRTIHVMLGEGYDDGVPGSMARIVIGTPAANNFPRIHELISGPFDADKMDYLTRDAHMCGVPVVTDVDRLVQKIRGVARPLSALPPKLKGTVKVSDDPYIVFGVARSGARTIDEIALGRSLMFDKIYRHQKVRAIEAMAGAAIRELGPILAEAPEMIALEIHDEIFLALTADEVSRRAKGRGVDVASFDLDAAVELVRRLRDRELFVRCFAFAQKMPFDALSDAQEQRRRNSMFSNRVSQASGQAEFLANLATTVREIADLIGRGADLDQMPGNSLLPYLAIDPPTSDSGNQSSTESYAYLVDEDSRLIEVTKANADTRGWVDAYVNTRDVGYVFAPAAIADIVNVATEVILRRDYEVRIPPSMNSYSKMSEQRILDVKNSLDEQGFFDDKLRPLRPEPDFLKMGDTGDRLAAIVQNFHQYAGPDRVDNGKVAPTNFDQASVRDWLKQFPDRFLPLAMSLVEKIKVIRRHDVNQAIDTYIRGAGFESVAVTPLGDPKDGSHIVAYHAGDAAPGGAVEILEINQALLTDKDIVFVDDFIGTGAEAITIIDQLLGETTDGIDLHEGDRQPLSPEARARFLKAKLHFVFVAGLSDGADALRTRLARLGVDADIFIFHQDDAIPSAESLREEFPDLLDDFIEFLRQQGAALLADTGTKADKIPDRLLGYGNQGKLIASSFNTPSITLTALWLRGNINGELWTPLIPRRKKP